MSDDSTPDDPPPERPGAEPPQAGWDPQQVVRDRAAATRKDRDQAIAELRESLDDEEILDEFGINLGEIEN
jgi:hypothetical protein